MFLLAYPRYSTLTKIVEYILDNDMPIRIEERGYIAKI